MNNKKTYVSAEIKLIDMSESDVIRTSSDVPGINLPDVELSSYFSGKYDA